MSDVTGQTGDLFSSGSIPGGSVKAIETGAVLLRSFVGKGAKELVAEVDRIAAAAPFRNMVTPGGFRMSVAMTNCGRVGWVTDRSGYRYDAADPVSGLAWPLMPQAFADLATSASAAAGFAGFEADACLINRYQPGTKMSLHQDKDEQDFEAPIVSVSLGLPATFLFGGMQRKDRPRRIKLDSGDVVVWGGPARLAYHGIATLRNGEHPLTGPYRINLTFRKAL